MKKKPLKGKQKQQHFNHIIKSVGAMVKSPIVTIV